MVCFPDTGDTLAAAPASLLSLETDGPFGAALAREPNNLVLRAASLMPARSVVRLRLHKALPLASGIGGGSADAAATLRLLSRLWSAPMPPAEAIAALGADVPVCLGSRPARMRGIGERVEPVRLPPFWVVLVNPGLPVATPAVFALLASRTNPPLPKIPPLGRAADLAAWLTTSTRNELQAAALALAPEIGNVLAALRSIPSCRMARMSGSGATCFGLFDTGGEAKAAADEILRARPGWWVAAAACRPAGPLPIVG